MADLRRILKAVEGLGVADFLKLRKALDRIEEKLWDRELAWATARYRKQNLSDAKIDALIRKRRRKQELL